MVIRVLIVGDVRLYTEGLAVLLEREATLQVAAIAAGRCAAMLAVRECRPDVVLLDTAMTEGLATAREIIEADPTARIIALAVANAEQDVFACVEAGAVGYLPRDGGAGDLIATVQSVARGEAIVSPRMAASIMRRVTTLAAGHATSLRQVQLTSRELEIVKLLDLGLSNKQIVARLNIELSTVKNHVHNILEKLRVHRRGDISREMRTWSRRRGDSNRNEGDRIG